MRWIHDRLPASLQRPIFAPQRLVLGPRRLVLVPKPRDFAVQLRNVAHKRVDRVANRGGESQSSPP